MNLKSKLFVSAVALTMVLGVAIPASAQTTAQLTAQINSLLAQIAQLQAQIGGTTTTTTGGTNGATSMFDKDLTVGSTGSNVVDLQRWLVNNEYLTMPVGVSYGYFGSLTRAAVAKFQVANGITPAVGYFGPKTMGVLNAMLATIGSSTTTTTTATPGCATGAMYSSTTGVLCSTTTVSNGTITTAGAEGTMTVTSSNANVVSTAYAGDSKDKILGFKVQALGSDIALQRVKVDLGSNTTQYNKYWQTLYVVDANGNVLGSLPLNSSTVVKDSGEYYATITGFNTVIPKGANNQYYIAADLYSTIDSTYQTGGSNALTALAITLASDGVRGTDGAGLDQYSPATGSTVTNSPTVSGNLTDIATLTVSSDASTPLASEVIATTGSNSDQYDQLPLLVFNLQAKKDAIEITDAMFRVAKTGAGGAVASSTLYLYDGSTVIGSGTLGAQSASGDYAYLTNINYTIPKDTTKTLTLKADIRSANATAANFVAYASSTGLTAQSSSGSTISTTYKSGSATGNTISVVNTGPMITLTSKSITTTGTPQGSALAGATSTLTATFNFHITALGGSVIFGTAASSSPAFASSTVGFKVYVGGAYNSSVGGFSTSTSWSFPSTCSTAGLTNSCSLGQNNSMDVAVTYLMNGRNTAGVAIPSGLYSIGVEGIQYASTTAATVTSATFMSGLTDWRTADVSFP